MDPKLLLGGVFAIVAATALVYGLKGDDPARQRLKEIAGANEMKRSKRDQQSGGARKKVLSDSLKDLEKQSKTAVKKRNTVEGMLVQAGFDAKPATFWFLSLGLAVGVALVALVLTGKPLIALGLAVGVGLGLPRWVLGMMVKMRQKKFLLQFADAIDMIVRGVRSGLPLGECLRNIAAESGEPLKSEFARLVDGISMGVPLETNLQRLYTRLPLSEVNFFAIVLVIQQKAGGNLSEALSNLSTVIRSRKMMVEKIGALSGEAKASAYIIGSLPFLVSGGVWFTNRDYLMTLFTEPLGNAILIGSGIWMMCGILVMRKLINFTI